MASLWCELLCKSSVYTFKSDRWIRLWWAKFELECLIIIFIIASIQNSRSLVKMKTLNASVSKFISKKKKAKIYTISVTILLFFPQNTLTDLPFWVLQSQLFVINHQTCFNTSPIKAKSTVPQSQACYLHTTHLYIFVYVTQRVGSWWQVISVARGQQSISLVLV